MNLTLDIRHRVERALFDRHEPSPVPLLDSALDFLRFPYAMGRDLLQGDLNLRAMSLASTRRCCPSCRWSRSALPS